MVWTTSNEHVSLGFEVSTSQPAAVAAASRLPSFESMIESRTRFGLSELDVLSIEKWYVTWSPILLRVSPVFVITTPGWNRFVEALAESVMSFVKPDGL